MIITRVIVLATVPTLEDDFPRTFHPGPRNHALALERRARWPMETRSLLLF